MERYSERRSDHHAQSRYNMFNSTEQTEAARERDPTPKFVELILKYDREIRRYIQALIVRRDDTDEVMQQTALVLWEKFSEYDDSRDFLPWAKRFAYFEALNFRKVHARNKLIFNDEVMLLVAETIQESNERNDERARAMVECLGKLGADDRRLLELRYGNSKTLKSIAEEEQGDPKMLYRRLEKIRMALLGCIDKQFQTKHFSWD